MKRHVQYPGIRRWSGDDLIDLQKEPLDVLDNFFEAFGPLVIRGVEVDPTAKTISAGMVALAGLDENGNKTFKVAPFPGAMNVEAFPVYLTLERETIERDYQDAKVRPIAYQYKAKLSYILPEGVDYIVIEESGNINLIDTLSNKIGLASETDKGLMSADDKKKLDGIATGANKYEHPTYTASVAGLYKVTITDAGHVSKAVPVEKKDITDLGIPGQDTTYSVFTPANDGLVPKPSANDQGKCLMADGTWQTNESVYYAPQAFSKFVFDTLELITTNKTLPTSDQVSLAVGGIDGFLKLYNKIQEKFFIFKMYLSSSDGTETVSSPVFIMPKVQTCLLINGMKELLFVIDNIGNGIGLALIVLTLFPDGTMSIDGEYSSYTTTNNLSLLNLST